MPGSSNFSLYIELLLLIIRLLISHTKLKPEIKITTGLHVAGDGQIYVKLTLFLLW
jgi:hypothetical protein